MNLVAFFLANPYVAVVVLLGTFYIRRARWRRRRRAGRKNLGYFPSASSLGNAMQNLQVLTRPTVEYVLEEKYDEDAEDDGDGGPEDPNKPPQTSVKTNPPGRKRRRFKNSTPITPSRKTGGAPRLTRRPLTSLLCQFRFERLYQRRIIGRGVRRKARRHLAAPVNQELLKIPQNFRLIIRLYPCGLSTFR